MGAFMAAYKNELKRIQKRKKNITAIIINFTICRNYLHLFSFKKRRNNVNNNPQKNTLSYCTYCGNS